jgi:hypothetical protein
MNRNLLLITFCVISSVLAAPEQTNSPRNADSSADCCATPPPKQQSALNERIQREKAKATALVAAVEPLLPPDFQRTRGPRCIENTSTIDVMFVYMVQNPELRGSKLVNQITRLFKERDWTEGMPPGISPYSTRRDGTRKDVIGFHKEPLLRTARGQPYCDRWAYALISDNETSLECTYSFPSPGTGPEGELVAVAYYSPRPEFHADGDRLFAILKAHEIFAISAESASIAINVPVNQAAEARKLISEAIAKEKLRVTIIP